MIRKRRFLRLQRSGPIDIVVTTSDRSLGGFGIQYMRSTTAVGNLKGAATLAEAAGQVSRRQRPINVTVSDQIETPLNGDLVLIGLPGLNEASRRVVTHLNRCYPALGLQIMEGATGCKMALGSFAKTYDVAYQKGTQLPSDDLALVVLWVNPIASEKRRLILCAGFTGYGTEAAASYLVGDFFESRYGRLRGEGHALPSLYASSAWPCFVMAIEVVLVNDQPVDIVERAFAAISDPGSPPFDGAPITDAFPDAYLQLDEPFSNELVVRRLIGHLRGEVLWYEQHMDRKALEILAEELCMDDVTSVRLLSGPANVTSNTKKAFAKFAQELGNKGVGCEWRVLSAANARRMHARVMFDGDRAFELPPLNSVLAGGIDSVRRSDMPRETFERAWGGETIALPDYPTDR
jgi:hypothetical protein